MFTAPVGQVMLDCGPTEVAGHAPQSAGQLTHVSLSLQVLSPHTDAQTPQSLGQVLQFSLPLQTPLPQPLASASQAPTLSSIPSPPHAAEPRANTQPWSNPNT